MRKEIAGEPPLEIEQREVLEKVIEEPEKGGITIHIDKGQMPAEPILSIHPKFRGISSKRRLRLKPPLNEKAIETSNN
ncbi:hypothetical protein EAH_00002770 [Eimeria acervulina]|uniref:Uncharacterized protein n=1 Tax=Eimeria acervulina TaxID=5801 RepID=U6GJN2_EIMAC|nr:hypothetical protein EAH_00002770 [Eimeria acervulina]CDI80441.1 hypothetical protein EAH_00002770 [Eimeria acervulina]